MKTIVFFVVDIHLEGGGERVVSNMAQYFTEKLGYATEIISMDQRRGPIIFPIPKSTKISYLDVKQDLVESPSGKLRRSMTTYRRLKQKLKTYGNDTYILGIGTYANVLLGLAPCKKAKKIGTEHIAFSSLGKLWMSLRKATYKKLEVVTSLTEKDVAPLSTVSKRCVVIPNARTFEPIEKKANTDNKEILAIGRFTTAKGYDYMLEVISDVTKVNHEWRFKIIGDGPLKDWILTEIKQRQLEDYITVLSPTKDIRQHYEQAAIYLMTSRHEGLPMVLLEAQAMGLPIVSFDCDTGPRDIITNGKDGFLIEPFDTAKLAGKLLTLMEDPDLRRRFSDQALLSSEKFSAENIYRKWTSLFETI